MFCKADGCKAVKMADQTLEKESPHCSSIAISTSIQTSRPRSCWRRSNNTIRRLSMALIGSVPMIFLNELDAKCQVHKNDDLFVVPRTPRSSWPGSKNTWNHDRSTKGYWDESLLQILLTQLFPSLISSGRAPSHTNGKDNIHFNARAESQSQRY